MEDGDLDPEKLIMEVSCKKLEEFNPKFTMEYILQGHYDKGYKYIREYQHETLGRIVVLLEPEV